MSTAIVDYGVGNLRSVMKAIEYCGETACVTRDPALIQKADRLVLPGVGAMAPAIKKLQDLDLVNVIKDWAAAGRPLLGICLGMQLLFDKSEEGGYVPGLGLLPGEVRRFRENKVPHMGWNTVEPRKDSPLWSGLNRPIYAYFCHSFYVVPASPDDTAGLTSYGVNFTSAVERGSIYGVQFHPEKSQQVGLALLKNFITLSMRTP